MRLTLEIENILAQTDGFTLRARKEGGPWSS